MDKFILMSVISFMLGMIINNIHYRFVGISGKLKIDHSNPEKDIYRLEIEDLDSLNKKKHVTLKVIHNADLSQK